MACKPHLPLPAYGISLRRSSQLEALQYKQALSLIDSLLTELKRLDDKMVLTEVHLLESRVYRGIGNFPKAKVRNPFCFLKGLFTLSE